jgi:hypothetical protein
MAARRKAARNEGNRDDAAIELIAQKPIDASHQGRPPPPSWRGFHHHVSHSGTSDIFRLTTKVTRRGPGGHIEVA